MRADKYFAEKFGSRTKAAEEIERGRVLVNGKPILPKYEIKPSDEIEFVAAEEFFVSNGGYKLSRALKTFSYNPAQKTFADIGASTGGFTDCLLQNGVKRVFAVDVGESLLHESLQNDARITRMENVNARYLKKEDFGEALNGVVADVSFISLKHILPVISSVLGENGSAFVLVKPQFECEKKNIGKSGIVHPSAHKKIMEKVLAYVEDSALYPFGVINAPVRKGKNIEYVLYLKNTSIGAKTGAEVLAAIETLVAKNGKGELS